MLSDMEAVIFSSCDPFHIYYKALDDTAKMYRRQAVFRSLSAYLCTGVCFRLSYEIHDMETAGNIANLTVA